MSLFFVVFFLLVLPPSEFHIVIDDVIDDVICDCVLKLICTLKKAEGLKILLRNTSYTSEKTSYYLFTALIIYRMQVT